MESIRIIYTCAYKTRIGKISSGRYLWKQPRGMYVKIFALSRPPLGVGLRPGHEHTSPRKYQCSGGLCRSYWLRKYAYAYDVVPSLHLVG